MKNQNNSAPRFIPNKTIKQSIEFQIGVNVIGLPIFETHEITYQEKSNY